MALQKGSTSEEVKSIQDWLVEMGFGPGKIDGDFGPKTEKALIRFQENSCLYADGVLGPRTMEALQEAYMRHCIEMTSPELSIAEGPMEDLLPFVRCEADKNKYSEGYDRFWLRSDAADAYEEVRTKVKQLGGIITSSGARRSLNAAVGPNRSAVSFHYLGLALDLYFWSGMEDPDKDPYVIKLVNREKRQFEVFARCDSEKVKPIKITNVVTYDDPSAEKTPAVEGPFISLTKLFHQHGFEPIRARPRFFEGGAALSAEWWHFQYEKALAPRVSTFGRELLKVYPLARLEGTPPWNYRDRIFRINWFYIGDEDDQARQGGSGKKGQKDAAGKKTKRVR